MTYQIVIERIPYEEPYHIQLVWNVSNGNTTSTFEHYDNAAALSAISKALSTFPRVHGDIFTHEIGSEDPAENFAYHFCFSIFNFGLQLRFCNNEPLPEREVIELCIKADTGALDRLGNLFQEFSLLEATYMVWSESEAFVGNKQEYA